MSNVVFILGAGCSKVAGAPLMTEFLDVASHIQSLGKVAQKKEQYEKVFKAIGFLQSVHSKAQLDIYNIESIFNAFEIANTIKKLPGFNEDEIPSVIDALKELIVTTIEHCMSFPTHNGYIGVPQPYEPFAEMVSYLNSEALPRQSVSIITFNYDIAIDMALFRARIPYDYCLENIESTSVPLLKLHGSLNWASRIEDDAIVPLSLNDYFGKFNVRFPEKYQDIKVPIGSQLKEYFTEYGGQEVKNEPVIVPPTWNKADHYSSLSTVWARAAYDLGEAEHIFILGYSLPETDAFFRLLYALGTVSNVPLKSIAVFNPDNNEAIMKRFESILGPGAQRRYEYNASTFHEAIPRIRGRF